MSDGRIRGPEEVVSYWCETLTVKDWWQSTPELDARVREQFAATHLALSREVTPQWRASPEARLAAIIVLDQFPRNMYRGTSKAFATDGKALVISKFALSKGFDQVLTPMKRRFLYLPFEHSENLNDQRKCVDLFEKMKKDDPLGYDYAMRHLKVIEKYGRFPHRNKILSRMNTPEEEEYLAQAGAGF